jgi:hypothetical protein
VGLVSPVGARSSGRPTERPPRRPALSASNRVPSAESRVPNCPPPGHLPLERSEIRLWRTCHPPAYMLPYASEPSYIIMPYAFTDSKQALKQSGDSCASGAPSPHCDARAHACSDPRAPPPMVNPSMLSPALPVRSDSSLAVWRPPTLGAQWMEGCALGSRWEPESCVARAVRAEQDAPGDSHPHLVQRVGRAPEPFPRLNDDRMCIA